MWTEIFNYKLDPILFRVTIYAKLRFLDGHIEYASYRGDAKWNIVGEYEKCISICLQQLLIRLQANSKYPIEITAITKEQFMSRKKE